MSAGPARAAFLVGLSRFNADRTRGEEQQLAPEPLPFAAERVNAVAEALRRYGYDCTVKVDFRELTASALRDGILARAAELGEDGLLLVHVLSHGIRKDGAALHIVGGDGDGHWTSDVEDWLRTIARTPRMPRALFLLDVCYAGAAARLPWQLSTLGRNDRVWVIAACQAEHEAFDGRFSQAVANVLNRLATSEIDMDLAPAHIPLQTVALRISQEVKHLIDQAAGSPQQVVGSPADITTDLSHLRFFPNLRHAPTNRGLARGHVDVGTAPLLDDVDETLDALYFMDRAAGHQQLREGRVIGCFSGRDTQLHTLCDWLDGDDDVPLRVVTGSPGAGKSALVGVLICAAHPLLRNPTMPLWQGIARRPRANPDLAAVHARQRTTIEVAASLRRQFRLPPAPDDTVDVDGLLDLLAQRHLSYVVIDALDEADHPQAMLDELILPLARHRRRDGTPVCRLLVAMRPWEDFAPLHELAEDCGGLINLDEVDLDVLHDDLDTYVNRLLRSHRPYSERRYAGARGTFAAAVAETLTTDKARENNRNCGAFLVAGMYTHHFATTYEPVQDNDRAGRIGADLKVTLPDLLELDLAAPGRPKWLRPLLAALAHARGEGMPAQTAGHVAAAFAGTTTGPTQEELTAAFKAARFYLRRATDVGGITLFRLFHQGLTDHLQRHPVSGDDATPVPSGAIVAAMLAPIACRTGTSRRWDVAEPYLIRHAIHHVRDSGDIAALTDDVEFLVHAEPAQLVDLLGRVDHPWLSAADAARLLDGPAMPHQDRRQLLALHAAEHGAVHAAWLLANPPDQAPLAWQPHWVSPGTDVTAMTCTDEGNLITGHKDGTIRIWAGDTPGSSTIPTSHEGPALALAVGVLGQPVLAAVHEDGRLTLWNLRTRARLAAFDVEPGPVSALQVLDVRGRLLLLVNDELREVRGFDAAHPFGPPLRLELSPTRSAVFRDEIVTMEFDAASTDASKVCVVDDGAATVVATGNEIVIHANSNGDGIDGHLRMPGRVEEILGPRGGGLLVRSAGRVTAFRHLSGSAPPPEPSATPADFRSLLDWYEQATADDAARELPNEPKGYAILTSMPQDRAVAALQAMPVPQAALLLTKLDFGTRTRLVFGSRASQSRTQAPSDLETFADAHPCAPAAVELLETGSLREAVGWLKSDVVVIQLLNFVTPARLVQILNATGLEQALTLMSALPATALAELGAVLAAQPTGNSRWLLALSEVAPEHPDAVLFARHLGSALRGKVARALGPRLPAFLQLAEPQDAQLLRALHRPESALAPLAAALFQRDGRFAAMALETLPAATAAAALKTGPAAAARALAALDPAVATEMFVLMRSRRAKQQMLSVVHVELGAEFLRRSGSDAASLLSTDDGALLRKYLPVLDSDQIPAVLATMSDRLRELLRAEIAERGAVF